MMFDCATFAVAEFLLIGNKIFHRAEAGKLGVFAGEERIGLVDRLRLRCDDRGDCGMTQLLTMIRGWTE